ncbi:type I-E CRISPR-associated protein Cse2/CasB [Deinococcus sp. Marseille-Q6407]|uniref:type I-E CRISPR-associated protein Cse2/CasB n=1 Tax=Deinococcus sp. Marseille-Q6407 TaxID=2969223 RepID=UPI0021C08361|nr:type I-E CRISPR-associated protein Cse2/CasB [Deinococcus sp. Marseille-Q6407]
MTRTPDDRPARFVHELTRLERGPLAQLRRGLGGDERSVYWLEGLYARTGYGEAPKYSKDALQLLAGLYALKPQARDEGEETDVPAEAEATAKAVNAPSIGKLMGRLYVLQGARPSTEKRFLALLDTDRDGLNYQMRQAVMLLSTKDLMPDWVRLADDLLRWGDPVRRRWARDFYTEIHRETPQDAAAAPTDEPAQAPNQEGANA